MGRGGAGRASVMRGGGGAGVMQQVEGGGRGEGRGRGLAARHAPGLPGPAPTCAGPSSRRCVAAGPGLALTIRPVCASLPATTENRACVRVAGRDVTVTELVLPADSRLSHSRPAAV